MALVLWVILCCSSLLTKGNPCPQCFTHKFQFPVIVLMLVEGGLRVKSFATLRAELYVMVDAVVFVLIPSSSQRNLHFAFVPIVFVTNVPIIFSLVSVPTGSVSASSVLSVSTGSVFAFIVFWLFSVSSVSSGDFLEGLAVTGFV